MPETTTMTMKRKLKKVRPGDAVRLKDYNFRVVAAREEQELILLELEGRNGEQSTLIGVPNASVLLSQDG
ncbi:hypothetical protein [Arthrobacter sp. ISL-30]|uniref:hypothetical protein n=1 Tax=Arthrobacter sp. ISL-30 TaxID=2819109 RepID=UPI001BE73E14|nr:hypothetical protein [Arthrobacter sp. ISL-30]MBT2512282.1 hypothetical protein [Arthrobacter sp. ISL-30]